MVKAIPFFDACIYWLNFKFTNYFLNSTTCGMHYEPLSDWAFFYVCDGAGKLIARFWLVL
jgi:hypothetical protein